uniref:fibronectin type III domain-containing protein n=1 Tax=Treponema endosymbiont of Eucomonympha sp. TaxID=1580831 RepID=UPI001396997E
MNTRSARQSALIGFLTLIASAGIPFGCRQASMPDYSPVPLLQEPTGVQAEPESAALRVTWNAVPGAAGYTVYGSANNRVSAATEKWNGAGTEARIADLLPNVPYYVWVQARNGKLLSGYKVSATAIPKPISSGLTAPALKAEETCDGFALLATLAWDDPS